VKNETFLYENESVPYRETPVERGPGGKLALWVFYSFCGYCIWALLHYVWVVSQIDPIPGATLEGELGSTTGKWLGALLGSLVLGVVGMILGWIAWYTRPRRKA
jgi:hypothetical protein